jgi:curved DNA-binding protein CbpA
MEHIKKFNENWEDPYKVLGLSPGCTSDDIKKAYRKIVIKYHPDKNSSPEAIEIFRKATAAYKKLTDPNRKEEEQNKTSPSTGKRWTPPVKKKRGTASIADTLGFDDLINALDDYLGTSNIKKNFGGGFRGLFD